MSMDCANKIQVTSLRFNKSTIFKCFYKWVISDVKGSKSHESSLFEIDDSVRTKFFWCFKRESSFAMNYEIKLMAQDRYISPSEQYFLTTEFSVLDSNDSKKHMACSGIMPYSTPGISSVMFIPKAFLENPELLHNDTLTILCKFHLMKPSEGVNPGTTTSSLAQDMKCLFERRETADVILQIGDESIKAHKLILTTRSPVFAAMFENEMEENKDNRVKITDITKDLLEEFLMYMYTDETPNLETMAMDLLCVAEKYQVESLKRRCEQHFFATATIEDAAEILINADLHNAKGFKKSVIQFINYHRKDFVETEGYKMLRESHARLVFEIFEAKIPNFD